MGDAAACIGNPSDTDVSAGELSAVDSSLECVDVGGVAAVVAAIVAAVDIKSVLVQVDTAICESSKRKGEG